MTNFKIKDDEYFTLEKSEGNSDFPRRFHASKISGSEVKIKSLGSADNSFADMWDIDNFQINGVSYTNVFDAVTALNKIVFNDASSADTPEVVDPYLVSETGMMSPTGELVWKQIYSDGTIKYVKADGTDYAGATADLVPYTKNIDNEIVTFKGKCFEKGATKVAISGKELYNVVEGQLTLLSGIYTITESSDESDVPLGSITSLTGFNEVECFCN